MDQIIVSCSKIERTTFPTNIDGSEYTSLTGYVHEITHNANLPFSAQLTDLTDRKSLVYRCTFYNTGCQAKLVFTHSTDFFNNDYFTFDIQNSCFHHINHPLNHHFVQCHRNCYSQTVCQNINFQAQLGVPPGRIRSNLNIECGSNIFYDIRRKTIENERIEDLDSLINTLQNGTDKRIICDRDGGVFKSLTVIDNEILNSEFSKDIAIIDDTAMTNMYGLPLEAVVVVDSENHSQLLGYSIIPNRSTLSFELFCRDYLQLGGSSFRIIVVDRLEAQFNALQNAFPDSYIMFCLVHIRKDLLSYFASNDEIIRGFENLRKDPMMSFQYLEYLKRRFAQMSDSEKGKRCIHLLIQQYEHWLPFYLIQRGMYLHFATSRIEGIFGLLKGNYGHDRGKILTTIKNLNNLCSVLKTQSYSTYSKTHKDFSNFPLIASEDLQRCGRMLLEFLSHELDAFLLNADCQPCIWCCLRSNNSPYSLPCRHSLVEGEIIDIKSIHPRFLRSGQDNPVLNNTVIIKDITFPQEKNRNTFLARIDPFLNYYGRNNQVSEILDQTVNNLENLQIHPNYGMPPMIAQSGRSFTHPAKNVQMGGRKSTKRTYKCTICGKEGHSSRSCPYKS